MGSLRGQSKYRIQQDLFWRKDEHDCPGVSKSSQLRAGSECVSSPIIDYAANEE